MNARSLGPLGVGLLAASVAALVLLPGLGEHGLWSEAELPVLDRARAALGVGLSDLERSPWLPDWARTWAYDAFGGAFGLRLGHALAVMVLAALAAGLARARGSSTAIAILAGAFVLAFPGAAVAGRTALGNPIGEALAALAVVGGLIALRQTAVARAAGVAGIAALALAGSIASSGLLLGGCVPLGALAAAEHSGRRAARIALACAVLVCLGVVVYLALNQGDGYIPALGAAKDLDLVSDPHKRRFAAGLEDFGYAVFPWAGLAAVGAAAPRGRWPAAWAVLAIASVTGWSLVYGSTPVPVAVPAALSCAAAVEFLFDPEAPKLQRRVAVLVAAGAILVMRKDAERWPGRIVAPDHDFGGEHKFPDEQLQAPERLKRIAAVGLVALIAAAIAARRRRETSTQGEPSTWRMQVGVAAIGAAAAYGAVAYARSIVPDASALLSPKAVLGRYDAWVAGGALPEQLAVHRVRDEGVTLYGPGDVETLASRRAIATYLEVDEPRAALIRVQDLGTVHQSHHTKGWPFFVLDDTHRRLRLVSNVLPEGATDFNRIPEVLSREPPVLANETLVRFENYVEVVGWEVDRPMYRGRKHTFKLAIKVLRPLPGGSKLYTRLMRGRLWRVGREPVDFAEDLYACNLWREGDFILHRFEFEMPWLEVASGEYDFVIGIRRGEKKNFDITVPEGPTGEFGVKIKDKKRNFARIGRVQVW